MYKRIFMAFFAVAAFCAMQACGGDDDDTPVVEPQFQQALKATMPSLTNVKWEKKGQWTVAEGREGQYDAEVWFDAQAKWAMTEYDYQRDTAKLPQAILSALSAGEYNGWAIDDIDFYSRPGMTAFYVLELESAGRNEVYAYYYEDGGFIKSTAMDAEITPDIRFLAPVQ